MLGHPSSLSLSLSLSLSFGIAILLLLVSFSFAFGWRVLRPAASDTWARLAHLSHRIGWACACLRNGGKRKKANAEWRRRRRRVKTRKQKEKKTKKEHQGTQKKWRNRTLDRLISGLLGFLYESFFSLLLLFLWRKKKQRWMGCWICVSTRPPLAAQVSKRLPSSSKSRPGQRRNDQYFLKNKISLT